MYAEIHQGGLCDMRGVGMLLFHAVGDSEMLGERLGVEIRRDLACALFRGERDVTVDS